MLSFVLSQLFRMLKVMEKFIHGEHFSIITIGVINAFIATNVSGIGFYFLKRINCSLSMFDNEDKN